ncbi:MAG: Immunoglobulin I-set domain protein [Pedosphaera sp.]|nr:Immunoglobulin I-set domain protein [Pedosphaera sp.]
MHNLNRGRETVCPSVRPFSRKPGSKTAVPKLLKPALLRSGLAFFWPIRLRLQPRTRSTRALAPLASLLWLAFALQGKAAPTTVVAWGANFFGQTNVPPGLTNAVAIAGGENHSLALKSDGTVIAWGDSNYGQINVPPGLSNVIAIAAGGYHSLALKSNGTVAAWGRNDYNQSTVPAGLSNVVAITCGEYHSLALKSDGTVTGWGQNDYNQSTAPPSLSNVVAIAAGQSFSLALASSGRVVGWGDNSHAEVVPPAGLSNVIAIATGYSHSLALKRDGTVAGWGANNLPAGLSNVVSISAGGYHNLFLEGDGTLILGGSSAFDLNVAPVGLTNVVGIAAGAAHNLALFNDGSPFLVRRPATQTAYSGATVSFSVTAVGAAPPGYQWQGPNNLILAGATNATLTLTDVQLADAGNYSVIVSNANGTITTPPVSLTVITSPPLLVAQPVSQTVPVGSKAVFSVLAAGSLPLSYQWQFGGTNIDGATNASFTLTNAQLADRGAFTVTVSNAFGTVSSSNAVLNVVDLAGALNATNLAWTTSGNPPWIPQTAVAWDEAAAQTGPLAIGQPSVLQTMVEGPGTLSFLWQVQSSNPQFETLHLDLLINGVQQAELTNFGLWQGRTIYFGPGTQTLRWVAAKISGPSGTNAAWLDLVSYDAGPTLPAITTAPMSVSVSAGHAAFPPLFTVAAIGTPPLGYQWQFNGVALAGATNSSLAIPNVQAGNAGTYAVVASNAYGATPSSAATLTVVPTLPILSAKPTNQIIPPWGSATFVVVAGGTDPLSYQWLLNGTNIPGATNTSLTVADFPGLDAGSYQVAVGNALGRVTSSPPAAILRNIPLAITTFAGLPSVSGSKDGTNTGARFFNPWDVTVDGAGVLYVADRLNYKIRKITSDQNVTTVAGRNFPGTNNGPVSSALFDEIAGVAVDGGGNFYVADTFNNTIRKISSAGVVSTLAGRAGFAGTNDGLPNAARFNYPVGVAVDRATNLYVADWANSTIRMINPTGFVSTIAGSAGNPGYVNATGRVARFHLPEHLALDNAGNIYVADTYNNAIRKLAPVGTNWVVSTLAGAGPGNFGSLDGIGAGARFFGPKGIAFDGVGSFYVADTSNNIVRRVTTGGVVTTPAGLAGSPGTNDGSGITPKFFWPTGLAVDGTGNVFIADSVNSTIRKGVPMVPPYILLHPENQTATAGGNAMFAVTATGAPPLSYQWLVNGTNLPGATNASLTLTNLALADPVNYGVVVTNLYGSMASSNAILTILRSTPQFDSLVRFAADGLGLQLNGLSGHGAVVIYASTNLMDWDPIFTNPPLTGTLHFLDPSATNTPLRFYRAIEQ